jgi:very-short-patch-repair endonuclease
MLPLYQYPENKRQQIIDQTGDRIPNLNAEIVKQIADKIGLTFVPEKFPSSGGVVEDRGGELSTGQVVEDRGGKLPSRHEVEDQGSELTSGQVVEDQGGQKRNTQNFMSLPYNPMLKERARELRKAGNLPEVLFWNQVKNKQFKDFDFDRQKIVGNYIVDFYCSNCNVVIEIDGSSHDDKVEYDAYRDEYLQGLGLTVIHIPVVEVMKNLGGVMEMLFNHPALSGTPPVEGNFAPIDILDYIYAVLHSPSYREKYKEFLKIDFPRVPYPKDKETFWQLVKLGGEIRQIHLLESPVVEQYITQYPIDGDNIVTKVRLEENYELINGNEIVFADSIYQMGRVYINESQFFQAVPKVAWEFYIGGYQPAQKWLKDRKDRKLEFEDILHYQKIVVALFETNRLMKEIDKISIE